MVPLEATDIAVDIRPITRAEIPKLRTLLIETLPTSGHLAGVFEAMQWSDEAIPARTHGLWLRDDLHAVVLMGQVIRTVTKQPALCTTIADLIGQHVTLGTAAVMGSDAVVIGVHEFFPAAAVRRFEVWERDVHAAPVIRVRPPEPAALASFARASFEAFREELGVAPVAHPGDLGYLELWQRAYQEGRILGAWDDRGRCIFRVEIRPALGQVAELRGLWLDPAWRGTGLAGTLTEEVLGYVAAHVAPRVQVIADVEHHPATRLYRRAGFLPVGALSRLDLPTVDA